MPRPHTIQFHAASRRTISTMTPQHIAAKTTTHVSTGGTRVTDSLSHYHHARRGQHSACAHEDYLAAEHEGPTLPNASLAFDSDRARTLMHAAALDPAGLARAARLPLATVSSALRGRRSPSRATATVLAIALGASPRDLLLSRTRFRATSSAPDRERRTHHDGPVHACERR